MSTFLPCCSGRHVVRFESLMRHNLKLFGNKDDASVWWWELNAVGHRETYLGAAA